MPPLRDIEVKIHRLLAGTDIETIESLDGAHIARTRWAYGGSRIEVDVLCSCGGKWMVPQRKDKDINAEIEATFKAHLSYFSRPATKID